MGEVFFAEADGDPTPYALKVLHVENVSNGAFIAMMRDEAKITGHLRHPNIVRLIEFAEFDGTYFMVMEFVDGVSLHRVLERTERQDSPLNVAVSLFLAQEIASALEYAHACSDDHGAALEIIHRDVTPGNVLLSRDGQIKLADFGIARAHGRSTRTVPGAVKGKLGYFAPEMIRQEPFDARVDVFSLGVTLYFMLANRHPTHDAALLDGILQFEAKRIPPPSSFNPWVAPELDALVMRSLEPKPENRWSSASDLRAALNQVAFGHLPYRTGLARAREDVAALVLACTAADPSRALSSVREAFGERDWLGLAVREPPREGGALDKGSFGEDTTVGTKTSPESSGHADETARASLVEPAATILGDVPSALLSTDTLPPHLRGESVRGVRAESVRGVLERATALRASGALDPSESGVDDEHTTSRLPGVPLSTSVPQDTETFREVKPIRSGSSSDVWPVASSEQTDVSSEARLTTQGSAVASLLETSTLRVPRVRWRARVALASGVAAFSVLGAKLYFQRRPAVLVVSTVPAGASVSLDGVAFAQPSPVAVEVTASTEHMLSVDCEGYEKLSELIPVLEPGERHTYHLRLTRIVPEIRVEPVVGRVLVNGANFGSGLVVPLRGLDPESAIDVVVEAPGFEPATIHWNRAALMPPVINVRLDR